jgi:hypothetical protein
MPQDESLVQAIRKAIESGFVLARQGFSDELKQTVELKKPRSRGRPKEKNLSITR